MRELPLDPLDPAPTTYQTRTRRAVTHSPAQTFASSILGIFEVCDTIAVFGLQTMEPHSWY